VARVYYARLCGELVWSRLARGYSTTRKAHTATHPGRKSHTGNGATETRRGKYHSPEYLSCPVKERVPVAAGRDPRWYQARGRYRYFTNVTLPRHRHFDTGTSHNISVSPPSEIGASLGTAAAPNKPLEYSPSLLRPRRMSWRTLVPFRLSSSADGSNDF